jgi:hypothetical protein
MNKPGTNNSQTQANALNSSGHNLVAGQAPQVYSKNNHSFAPHRKVRLAQDHSKPCNDLRVWSLRKRQAILLNQTAKNPAFTRLKTDRQLQRQLLFLQN